ncbi:hypothetical protein F4801DRAFT_527475 [Xylaria longipes]|nr:hypothetical protein F4801DRAFT_527475 [Xylaria longipes]RYC62815.1 hypothetical protein CHU98_g3410 [Xylaria longipes]
MSRILTDKEIDDASKKLAAFRATSAEEDFLQRYADLLTSYQQLKSDFEEEKVNRERYKQLARNQERNPFVLVLIDGDGYIFQDEFLHMGADGGSRLAQHLNNVVKQSLRRKGLDNCDIMVRVYANLANLSRTLSKHGLATADKRSLSPFVANFNRSYGLMDFVDAGELKENADFKIRALLNLYAENAQCKHIYAAVCHDVGYLGELTKFRGHRDRFTLVRSSGLLFHDQFLKLDLEIEELRGIFRTVPLEGLVLNTKPNSSTDLMKTTPLTGASAASDPAHRSIGSRESQKICQYYPVGKCRFGRECINTHIDARIPASANSTKPLYASQAGHYGNFDGDTASGSGRMKSLATSSLSKFDNGAVPAELLPKKSEIPDGYVAVNKNSQRLDPYITPPSPVASSRLRELSSIRKFCNSKQLTNSCTDEICRYEHKPLPEELLPALEWLSRSLPCSSRGSCRDQNCVQGHMCQNMECHHRGGKIKCKLPGNAHGDLTHDHFVPANPDNTNNATNSHTPLTASPLSSHVNQVPNDENPWDFS